MITVPIRKEEENHFQKKSTNWQYKVSNKMKIDNLLHRKNGFETPRVQKLDDQNVVEGKSN